MANSHQYKERHGELVVHSFVEFDSSVEASEVVAQVEDGQPLRVGTMGLVNKNGQEVAAGALQIRKNQSVPMYVAHNKLTLPFGRWEKLELRNSTDLYAVPRINNTTQGEDLKIVLSNKEIKGVSWTVAANTYNDVDFRKAKRGEASYFNEEVMIVTAGKLVEISFVYDPADNNARLTKDMMSSRKQSPLEAAIQNLATQEAARKHVIRKLIKENTNG